MATRNVNEINITNFVNTGLTTAIPRYSFEIEVKWTDTNGELHTFGPVTRVYPNAVASMPLANRRKHAQTQIIETAMVEAGAATWEEFE